MRSKLIKPEFWYEYCGRIFEGFEYKQPDVTQAVTEFAGVEIRGTNTFFVNGKEDPWQWASVKQVDSSIGQISRLLDCVDCGHCTELKNQKDSDPQAVKDVQAEIRAWLHEILNPRSSTDSQAEAVVEAFLQ